MQIQKIRLQNFKRFTDLTIDGIPENTKLVLLIGANGSGKSSVFEVFDLIRMGLGGKNYHNTQDNFQPYYLKNQEKSFEIRITTNDGEIFKDNYYSLKKGQELAQKFFGRSSIRIVPKILNHANIGQIATDNDSPKTYIENDTRFINDVFAYISEIDKALREPVFSGRSADTLEIFRTFIQPLNISLYKIFGENETISLQIVEFQNATPSEPAKLIFKKGESKINYDLLSHGEKQVIILLLNFIVRRKYYEDAIIFIDEMDCHLNTSLQYNLLKEITENWIPDNSQLWTASHALGFIDYAHDSENAEIIDFDSLDFDKSQILTPQPKENLEIFELAVSKDTISKILEGRKIVFSENTDTVIYNNLSMTNTYFFNAIDKGDVFHKAKNLNTLGLIDRDFLNDEELENLSKTYPFLKILPYYSIENLLFHPDNLEEYYLTVKKDFIKVDYINALINLKNQELVDLATGITLARNGYPFYKENESSKLLKDFKENLKDITKLLKSDDFETFYKVFPAKDYGKSLPQRANLTKINLGRTNWFRNQIEKLFAD